MRRLGKTIAVLLLCLLLACPAYGAGIALFLGANQISGIPDPLVAGNGLLVPADVLRLAGADIISITAESAHFRIGANEVLIKAGSSTVTLNGIIRPIDTAAVTEHNTLFLPLHFLADILSLRVSWDQQDSSLRLTQRQTTTPGIKASGASSTAVPVHVPAQIAPKPQEKISSAKPTTSASPRVEMQLVEPPLPDTPVPMALPATLPTGETKIASPQLGGMAASSLQGALPKPIESNSKTADIQQLPVAVATITTTVAQEKPIEGVLVAKANWVGQSGNKLETRVYDNAGVYKFVINGVKSSAISTMYVPAPHRLVIDIDGFVPAANLDPWNVPFGYVLKTRVAPNKNAGRIVLDLTEVPGYQVEPLQNGVVISFNRVLHNVSFLPAAIGGQLSFDLPATARYQVTRLSAPERLVIDLPNTTLSGKARSLPVNSSQVKTVRVSQYTADTTRVVLDLVGPIINPFQLPQENLQFVFHAQVDKVGLVDLGQGRQLILVEGTGPLVGKLSTLKNPDRIVLDFENACSPVQFSESNKAVGLVQALRAAQYQPHTFRIVAEVGTRVRAHIVELKAGKIGVLVETPTLVGSRIVIDAGHGGSDPGAIGRTSLLRESDVNLAVAQQLEALLREAKATVTLTRTTNSHIFLADRPVIASRFDPDLFISVHANSSTVEQLASGTETLYWNTDNGSRELAQTIQSELTASIGTVSRGAKQQNLLVLREAKVPAVLVEVAFISHPDEEVKLADPAFRMKAAEGIFNGIVRYMAPNQTQNKDTMPLDREELWQLVQRSEFSMYLPVNESTAVSLTDPVLLPRLETPERSPLPQIEERPERLHSGQLL